MSNTEKKLLLVEDDQNLGNLLMSYLNAKGYQTEWRQDGVEGFDAFMQNKYDLCILDVMMPNKDGFTLAKEIREKNTNIPIVFLTAKSMKEDVIKGFSLGADDYITKPFNMEELLYRIEAVLRRSDGSDAEERHQFDIGKYKFDTNKQMLLINEDSIKLTTKESELLRLLCLNQNKVLERNYALKSIWKDDSYFNARSMDVYITKLRKHLNQDDNVEIMNVHGEGFKLII